MNRLRMITMCLLAMMAASLSAKAQEVTITLFPGWNWISYPKAETQDISSALGDFEPVNGDMLKSQFGNAVYSNGYWRGSVTHFIPGWGYKYYSNRTEVVSFVFGETAPQLTVTTVEPTEITAITAVSGGSLTSSDGSYIVVLEKGICWATHPNPTVMNDFHTENGGGINSFTAEMTDLELNTVYYLRAYAVTERGTTYGQEMSFTTREGIPLVCLDSITNIRGNSAICHGTVVDNGGLDVLSRGVCWSTSPNPTLSDNHTINGTGTGNFSSNITGLEISTTYYVRAYATTNAGTAYSNEVSFTTEALPDAAINGKFTIKANGDQVYFSQGNLQYQASTNTWKFAENQYDYVGSDNSNISSTYDGWIDLFGWGTSGYNHGANCYQPWSTSTSNSDYYAYGNWQYNLYDETGQADWGFNAINNGGNTNGIWRTLTWDEWNYVLFIRNTMSGIRFAKAKVNEINGIIILPDTWNSLYYTLIDTNNGETEFSSNIISEIQWPILQNAGAVFLPAGGFRSGISVMSVDLGGVYWSSSNTSAAGIGFDSQAVSGHIVFPNRSYGLSVRLVQDNNP